MSKRKKERLIVVTCLKESMEIDYREIWDKIMRDTIEKKYGKIK